MVHGVLKDELAVFAAAQKEKENDYLQAKEVAEAAAAAAAVSEATKKEGEQYAHLVTQVQNITLQVTSG